MLQLSIAKFVCLLHFCSMQTNNWTNQLLSLEVGKEKEFDVKYYDVIISTKTRLSRNDKGQWQSKKQIGSKTFTVRRTK